MRARLKIPPFEGYERNTTHDRLVMPARSTRSYTERHDNLRLRRALSSGVRCQITSGKQITRSINVGLGASRSFVAGQLGISSAGSTTTTVSCTSPGLKKGQVFSAYALGDRYKYQVFRKSKSHGIVIKTETSGWLHAFDPYRNDIACGYWTQSTKKHRAPRNLTLPLALPC